MNSLPKTVARQRRDCDFNPGPSAPVCPSVCLSQAGLSTRLPSHPDRTANRVYYITMSEAERVLIKHDS